MKKIIENEYLKIVIASHGAELQSIQDSKGQEYLWQGDKCTWTDQAPNIFPYVGRLTQGKYLYRSIEYQMQIHGFVKDAELQSHYIDEQTISFSLRSNEDTKKIYPFSFFYKITYKLEKNRLIISYYIENQDDKIMYFGVGGHPGFQVPIEPGLQFQDYQLDFGVGSVPYQVGMSEDCFITDEDTPYKLRESRYLDLNHTLFDHDAIILRDMSKKVCLQSPKGKKRIVVEYPQMTYLGLWHWPKAEVDYLCIEPWSSLPSHKDIVESLETQENLNSLDPGAIYENTWSIEITE
ncbi:MAG: aldose 1-epimerase family protein [Lachnospiraceae bacterium]